MIIFGNRGHYSAIGGVENSIRSLIKVASDLELPVTLVCREAMADEPLDVPKKLPEGVNLVTYCDERPAALWKRLLTVRKNRESLYQIYRDLYLEHPLATVLVRHHLHAVAAESAGFTCVKYLVPSITVNQLIEEFTSVSLVQKLKIIAHILVHGPTQRAALVVSNVFVFSRSMEQQVRKLLPKGLQQKPIAMVKPGVDPARFTVATLAEKTQLREHLQLPKKTNLFIFVGRFVQAKGLDYLIDAFAMMPDDCSLVLVGEGEREDSIREKVIERGLQRRVILAGRTSRVEDFYRAADVFVMSSTYEPLGQTILEAAASGLRLVAFHPDAGVNTATHELDLDFAIDYAHHLTAESLAVAMQNSLKSASEEGSRATGRRAQSLYSWSVLFERMQAK